MSATERLVQSQLDIFRERAQTNLPGAAYVAVFDHSEHRMVFVPTHLALSSQFDHAKDYGSGCFEGGSAVINERTGVPNVILHEERVNRLFNKSIPARGYNSPVAPGELSQSILEVVAINGLEMFNHPKIPGQRVRAYIRPTVSPAPLEGYGVTLRKGSLIDAAVIAFAWPDYLDPRVYTEGMRAAVTGHQRLFPITGKHASNYGAAGMEGSMARSMGADELIYLAPYLIDVNGHQYWSDPNNGEAKLTDGVLADGPGEEIFAVTADQKTIVYPPMRVNRLGGTVLQYMINYMAPNMGLAAEEGDITIRDLKAGKYCGLAMAGNAVKIAPVSEIVLYREGLAVDLIELFVQSQIPETIVRIMNRWDGETQGLVDPSHKSLLTPVDMDLGLKMRRELDKQFLDKHPPGGSL